MLSARYSDARTDLQLIAAAFEHSVGSVWFVRAIGVAYLLWHRQTIRFLHNQK